MAAIREEAVTAEGGTIAGTVQSDTASLLEATDPLTSAPVGGVTPNQAASSFVAAANAALVTVDDRARAVQGRLEGLIRHGMGNGRIEGGVVTPALDGSLNVMIAAGRALVGHYVRWDAPATVPVFGATTTNLYLRQTGVFTAASPAAPLDLTDGNGDALLAAAVVATASTITGVTTLWPTVYPVLDLFTVAGLSDNATLDPARAAVYLLDASGGNRDFTLPAPAARQHFLTLKRVDSSAGNTCTVPGASGVTIDGAASFTLAPGRAVTLAGFEANWYKIADLGA